MILRRNAILALGVAALVPMVASPAYAQAMVRAKVTDEWKNPIAGVKVTAVASTDTVFSEARGDDYEPREFVTDDNGEFFTRDFSQASVWVFTCHAEGYETVSRQEMISRGFDPTDLKFVLPVAALGERFRGTRVYEAEGGVPRFSFQEDGVFSFKEADGEGAGTYDIVERTVLLVVRTFDGPDDKYPMAVPIEVRFLSSVFPSFRWGETKLSVLK